METKPRQTLDSTPTIAAVMQKEKNDLMWYIRLRTWWMRYNIRVIFTYCKRDNIGIKKKKKTARCGGKKPFWRDGEKRAHTRTYY